MAGPLFLRRMATLMMTAAVCLLLRCGTSQTLARPGWAGSGMKTTQWWQNSVIVEVSPEHAGSESVLSHTRRQLGDLQTLGTDALLLRGMDTGTAENQGEAQLSSGYGTMEDFDQLMREASGRRIRLMVELPAGPAVDAMLADARFWLNRGVSGVYVQGDAGEDGGRVRALRGVLRSYVGDRVLIVDGVTSGGESATRGRPADQADMTFATLRGFGADAQVTDAAEVRASIDAARRVNSGVTVAEVDPKAPVVTGDQARARATALLVVRGSVALRAQDVGLGPEEQARLQEEQREAVEKKAVEMATSPAAASNARRAAAARKASAATAVELSGDETFVWYSRMIGLHRGNAAMLGGEQTLFNVDDTGALAAVWQARAGQPLVAVVCLRAEPCKLNLTEDFAKMRMRGLFLRAVLRTDKGMGAMPLGNLSLPGYGVYMGQLGR